METPNIQLYNFLRYDFFLSDIKSLEYMHILDKEYKSGFKDDFTTLEKKLDEGFLRADKRMDEGFLRADKKMDDGFLRLDTKMDAGFLRLDKKLDDSVREIKDVLQTHGKRLDDLDKHVVRLDNRIDLNASDTKVEFSEVRKEMQVGFTKLQVEIRDSKFTVLYWLIGLFIALASMILAPYLRK